MTTTLYSLFSEKKKTSTVLFLPRVHLSNTQDNAKYLLFTVVKDAGALPKQEERLHPFLEVFDCTSKCNWLCSYSV